MNVMSRLPIRSIRSAAERQLANDQWPVTLPAVRQLLDDGIELGALTVIVGENGAGKSTLVEAIAIAYGLSAEGGSTGARHSTRDSESALWKDLTLVRGAGASRWGYFLRAETMHGFYTYLEEHPGGADPIFHEVSHGESFLDLLGTSRFDGPGLFVFDEPESALSFSSSLALVSLLHQYAVSETSQAIVATHSPIIAATPDATILEVGDWGLRAAAWEDLDVVRNWSGFLADPQRYLRHVI